MEEIIKQNSRECPHCKFLYETFLKYPDPYNGERDYYLMTEVFVYLHGGDVCNYFRKEKEVKNHKMKINQLIEAIEDKLDIGFTPKEIQSIIVSKEDILSMQNEGSPWSKSIRSEGIAGVPVLTSSELDNHFEMIVVDSDGIHFFKEKWKTNNVRR